LVNPYQRRRVLFHLPRQRFIDFHDLPTQPVDLRQILAQQQPVNQFQASRQRFLQLQQFASWEGVCQGTQESARVCYSHRSAKGNRFLRRLLRQIAWAAIHTKNTFFGSLFARWQCPRSKPRVRHGL
jgi:hypothetical protein